MTTSSVVGFSLPEVMPAGAAASVPCGSCKLCCKKTLVLILPDHGDDPAQYETEPSPFGDGMLTLKFKANGDCIYLGEKGCTIHDRAPFMCRIFDCREQHRMYTKQQREDMVKKGMLTKDVLRRGAILIHQEQKHVGMAERPKATDCKSVKPSVRI